MRVGDLVTFGGFYKGGAVGIIIRCIPGWSRAKVVVWMDGTQCSYPEKSLKVMSCK